MSLISDALKRVEEQRASSVGVDLLPEMAASFKRGTVRRRLFVTLAILLPAVVLVGAGIYMVRWQFLERSSLTAGVIGSQPAVSLNAKQSPSSLKSPLDRAQPPPTGFEESAVAIKSLERQHIDVKTSVPAARPNDEGASKPLTAGPSASLAASAEPKPSPAETTESLRSEATGRTGFVQVQSARRESLVLAYREAVSLQKQGRWQEALAAYKRILDRVPTSAEVYNNLGAVYQRQGDLESAVTCYEKAIEIDPRFYPSFNNLGIIFYEQKDFVKARVAYERALAVNPNNYQSLVNLALVYEKSGRLEQARQALEQVLSREPGNAEALYNLARLLDGRGEYEAALEHYSRFLALRPIHHPRLQKTVSERISRLLANTAR